MKKLTVKTYIKHDGEYTPIEQMTGSELSEARKAISEAMSNALSDYFTWERNDENER